MSKRVVLEEEEYVHALEKIIERDFFPDLPTLRKHVGDHAEKDAEITTQKRQSQVQPTTKHHHEASLSWDDETPQRNVNGEEKEEDAESAAAAAAEVMTLNQFVATHTSEDNESFVELQEKAIEDHQRKYHWAFEQDPSTTKLLLLTDGTKLTTEQRRLADEACDYSKGRKDARPNAPATWRYRPQNPLLFPPTLDDSRDICQIAKDASSKTLLLGNGPSSAGNARSGRPVPSKKTIVYANSRFSSDTSDNQASRDKTPEITQRDLSLVEMTPTIAPGIDASPLMTWGEIEATPMRLDGAEPSTDASSVAPRFHVKDSSKREQIAERLESEARHRRAKRMNMSANASPLLTPQSSSSKRHKTPNRPSSTPASTRSTLHVRMTSLRTPLRGTDLALQASYSSSTKRLPPRHTPRRS